MQNGHTMDDKVVEDVQKMLVQLESAQLVDTVFIESLAVNPEDIDAVAEKWGDAVYSTIFQSLTHRMYAPAEARQHWFALMRHRRELIAQLGRNPGIAVVALDYFTNFSARPEKLGIIQESKLSEIAGFATKDELTGLYVRKVFESICTQQVNEAHRYNNSLCLLMADIDDFKQFNDTHGHQAGDQILKRIGPIINDTIRDADIAARYGGEEIAIIAPKTGLPEAFALGERLRQAIEQGFPAESGITLSIGIAELGRTRNKRGLIEAADRSLYRAKAQGKNRCVSLQE